MTNQELELRIKELIKISNYFDMVIAIKNFEKEYKDSEFFKITRQPLMDAVKNARIHYALQLDTIQEKINSLSLDNLNEIIEKFGEQLEVANQENEDFLHDLQNKIEEIK